jgi:hypothetical protein
VAPHVALGDDVSLPAPSYIGEWGVAGTDTGAFSTVRGIACGPDGRVFVADWGNQRVQVFAPDSSSPSIIDFSLSDENYSLAPWDLTVDPEDTLYVASFGGIIQRFDPTGSRIPGEWKTADFEVPGQLPGQNIEGIEASPHYIYVTVSRLSGSPPHNNGGIVQLARSGSVQREIAVWDSTNQFINELQGLATDRLDNVYVVINFTSALSAPLQTAIRKYDKNGLRLANWSMTPGDIQGLCCDASRVLYYTTASGHVRVLADQSETACDNNASDSPRGNFSIIEGLACDSTSRLYVVDRRNGLERVVVLDIDADGDGLLDAWEKYGIVASNVKPNYQLDDSHVQKKDLYIELDYAGGDTLFTTAALEMLADSLAVVPSSYFARPNPGDYPGVMLHLQADEIAGTQT